MRITIPNPLGGPITLDTSAVSMDSLRGIRSRLGGSTAARRTQLRVLVVMVIAICMLVFHPSPPLPPTYATERQNEKYLPQHDLSLPFPEGRGGRYVKFDVPRGTGFNHLLQRVLLQHHVAFQGNRSFVFEPFVQDETSWPFEIGRWPWRSAKVPLSAFVGNVLNGFERHYDVPRAVSDTYFQSVCPRYARQVYTVKSEENPEGDLSLASSGVKRIEQLVKLLHNTEKGCVHIVGDVFDDRFLDSDTPKQIADSLVKSPVLQHFHFSPSILAIVNRMLPEIAAEAHQYDLSQYTQASTSLHRTAPLKHILALHIRRGDDWEETCTAKGSTSDPFVAFNQLPHLPGNENVPPPPDMVEATRLGLYRAKCLPDVPAIIARARRMRKNHPLLRSIYILTDGPDDWAEEIRRWLASDAWDKVFVGKADVYPEWADHEIGIAADMEIARRAGVFVGTGFSTTSSNIVLLRTRDGVHPDFTQFW